LKQADRTGTNDDGIGFDGSIDGVGWHTTFTFCGLACF
jgi:hypothetical protein